MKKPHMPAFLTFALLLLASLLMPLTTVHAQGSAADLPSANFGNSLLGPSGAEAGTINAVLAFKRVQEMADEHYKAERYERAFKFYLELAKYNDKFSQYRVGSMYARGRGVEQDMAEAYAWTYVASEGREKGFVNYHVKLRDGMEPAEIERGKALVEEYMQDYGTFAVANKARRLIREGKRDCTGSRVGGTCDKVSSTGFNCGLTSQGQLGRNCLTLGAVGLPAIAGIQPADLRSAERQLDTIIRDFNPGRVELRELEIIEDE